MLHPDEPTGDTRQQGDLRGARVHEDDDVSLAAGLRTSGGASAERDPGNDTKPHRSVAAISEDGRSALEAVTRQIAQGSRDPFRAILGEAIANAPESEDWQALASRAPDKYVRAVRDLAPLAHTAYEARSRVDHSHVTMDANSVALELVRRYGRERASTMLQASGMPAALAQQAEDQIKGEPSADHIDHE